MAMIKLKAIAPSRNPFDVNAYRRARSRALDETARLVACETQSMRAGGLRIEREKAAVAMLRAPCGV